jgi:hypothetical protein
MMLALIKVAQSEEELETNHCTGVDGVALFECILDNWDKIKIW